MGMHKIELMHNSGEVQKQVCPKLIYRGRGGHVNMLVKQAQEPVCVYDVGSVMCVRQQLR